MSLYYAKFRLTEWGHWSRDRTNGYPTRWAVEGGLARSPEFIAQAPPHIELVDVIVRQLDVEPRQVLIVHYTQTGSGREKAVRLGLTKDSYFRRLEKGQWAVHTELEYSECLVTA